MSDRSENTVLVVSFGLVVLLLLVSGGVWFYYMTQRQHVLMAVALNQAYAAEAQSKLDATNAQTEAARAVAALDAAGAGGNALSPDQADSIRAAIERVLRTQEEAWNRGDLDAFMEHYWKSDDLTFSSGGKTTRGWTATLDRYRQRYPTREQMGRTTFSGLEITPLGDSAAMVLGQWKLDRESEPLSGNFSLVFRKLDNRWLIIHDHTSRLME